MNHTTSIGIIAYGAELKQTFANAARCLFSLITEIDDVDETRALETAEKHGGGW